MKAEQSSLYRQLERLYIWCLETFENAPKNDTMGATIRDILLTIKDAAATVETALNAENAKQRFDLLDIVVFRMSEFKFLTKCLTEYSSNPTRKVHVISKSQRIQMLDIMTQIGIELGRWRNATARKITSEAAKLPD